MAGPRVLTAAALACVALAACGSSPTASDGARVILSDPSFSTDIQEIFERRGCTGSSCHGAAKQGGLSLAQGEAYANLVNVPSPDEPGRIRVIPDSAEQSYLVIKLEGRQSFGARMPNGLPPLDSVDMANIRNWINAGAKNN